jgi:hypothetical protein
MLSGALSRLRAAALHAPCLRAYSSDGTTSAAAAAAAAFRDARCAYDREVHARRVAWAAEAAEAAAAKAAARRARAASGAPAREAAAAARRAVRERVDTTDADAAAKEARVRPQLLQAHHAVPHTAAHSWPRRQSARHAGAAERRHLIWPARGAWRNWPSRAARG